MKGTIFVNRRGNILHLQAAVRRTLFDVVLASLLLHERSHLLGATLIQGVFATVPDPQAVLSTTESLLQV